MDLVTETQFRKLQDVIGRVLESPRSDFYRNKYQSENFSISDLKKVADIYKVPRLTREELSSTSPFDHEYSDTSEIKFIRYTSGTSKSPAMLLFRPQQRYRIPGERPLLITANNQLDAYFSQALRAEKIRYPPLIHAAQSISLTAALAEAYRIDAVVGLPSRMLELAGEMTASAREKVFSLFIQGERFTEGIAKQLHKYFPNAVLDPRYGMTEVGLFGFQCLDLRKKDTGIYHCEPEYLLEITNQENGKPIHGSEEGEIVITELYESPHQIIRYRTGDAGRIVSEQTCACGAPFTFEVIGRIDHDIMKVAGGLFRVDEFERVIGHFQEWFKEDFRAAVSNLNDIPAVELTLIPRGVIPETLTSALKDNIAKQIFVTPTKTVADFVEEGRFGSFQLSLTQEFPREAKIKRLRVKEN